MTAEQIQAESQRYMVKVYTWMSFALVITGGVAILMFALSSASAGATGETTCSYRRCAAHRRLRPAPNAAAA